MTQHSLRFYPHILMMPQMKFEKIDQELSHAEDGVPSVSISVGIVHGSQANDIETLLRKGDEAMYKSKAQGKHTFTFYDS